MTAGASRTTGKLVKPLKQTVEKLSSTFSSIPQSRKELLLTLTKVIDTAIQKDIPVNLNFICTHNSRRSHMAQLWAQASAHYYGIEKITCFSGGTEATAFNPRAVEAMKDAGFDINQMTEGTNPKYTVRYSDEAPLLNVFSKTYDDASNPGKDFVAVMTCSHADENCPIVRGALERIAITYDDPKDFDGMPAEKMKYRERTFEIGREMLYAFSQVTAADKS